MTDENFSIRWDTRSDSKFYAIDSATYPATSETTDWRKSQAGNTMVVVRFRFDEVRVTKPSGEIAIERNRSLDDIFMFDHPWQIEHVFDYLVASGTITKEALEAEGE